IEMPGGTLGHLHSHVDAVPSFRPGEEAYLFLWMSPAGQYRLLGWGQGTFRITRDDFSGMQSVTQDSASTPVFNPASRKFEREGIRRLPLTVFQAKLRHALENPQR